MHKTTTRREASRQFCDDNGYCRVSHLTSSDRRQVRRNEKTAAALGLVKRREPKPKAEAKKAS